MRIALAAFGAASFVLACGASAHHGDADFDAEAEITIEGTFEGAPESVQGHSIGRWEGDTLVVDTRRFAPHAQGITSTVPSSREKHLVERFRPTPDGTHLSYTVTLEDPVHLERPVSGEVVWAYRPDLEYRPLECDRENARRFLRHR